MKWYGHMLRLPDDVPARRAYEICKLPTKRPKGRYKTTWISAIKQELQEKGLTIEDAEKLAMNKKNWRLFCKNI